MSVTRISSRGQVVIPREIRESMELKEGQGLLVFKVGDSIILKNPTMDVGAEISENLTAIRKKVKALAITRDDVDDEIRKIRLPRKKTRS